MNRISTYGETGGVMSTLNFLRLARKRAVRARKLNTYIQTLSTDERIALNVFLMSGEGPLTKESNLNEVLEYLLAYPLEDMPKLVAEATEWIVSKHQVPAEPTDMDSVDKDTVSRRELNLNLGFQDGLDPSRVIVLSRDVNDDSKLALQEIDVDSGDYVPIPTAAIANILRDYASSLEERQERINRGQM